MTKKTVGSVLFLVCVLGLCCLGAFRGALVDQKVAVEALETNGFSDITVQEHAYLFIGVRGGDRNDAARFTCKAKNPAGKEVTVHVFSGWPFKGATIRHP